MKIWPTHIQLISSILSFCLACLLMPWHSRLEHLWYCYETLGLALDMAFTMVQGWLFWHLVKESLKLKYPVELTEETASCSLALQLLHLIQNFHLHWNIISSHFTLALQCQPIRHKDKPLNLWAFTYQIMCSPMTNCMLLSAELQTHQLLLCAWITQIDLQETLCFRKFCDFPCTLCPKPSDLYATWHSVRSTGWPLVDTKNNGGIGEWHLGLIYFHEIWR